MFLVLPSVPSRRLSIGCTLVTLPSVLILDEPTSGLDAWASHMLLLLLAHLASRGRTVILSLHAPRSDAWGVFDRLCVLTKGEVAYSGPTQASLAWFSSRGLECGEGVNPLDFLVDISSIDYRDPEQEDESRERVGALVAAWKTRSVAEKEDLVAAAAALGARPTDALRTISTRRSQHSIPLVDPSYDARRPGILAQTTILLRRSHLNVYRNVPQLLGFAAQAVIIGLLMGLTFLQLGESPADVQSTKNASFQLIPAYHYLQTCVAATASLVAFLPDLADVAPSFPCTGSTGSTRAAARSSSSTGSARTACTVRASSLLGASSALR